MESGNESEDSETRSRQRVDWRTGKAMVQHDASFWREHERRRVEQSLSVRQYCLANGLALSTYRHRVSGRRSRVATSAPASTTAKPNPTAFIPISPVPVDQAQAEVEIALEGMTLRLLGGSAERIVERVMARLG